MFLFAVSEMQIKNKPSSVNLYLMDLANPDLVDEMKKREKHFTFNPSQICLEVLECNY